MRMGKVFDPKVCVTLLLLFRTLSRPTASFRHLGFFWYFLWIHVFMPFLLATIKGVVHRALLPYWH